jgi:hypothetical protein
MGFFPPDGRQALELPLAFFQASGASGELAFFRKKPIRVLYLYWNLTVTGQKHSDLGGKASEEIWNMSKPVIEVQVRAVAAVSDGCAVFLGNEDKVFVMFVDQSVGAAITMFMQGTQKERP